MYPTNKFTFFIWNFYFYDTGCLQSLKYFPSFFLSVKRSVFLFKDNYSEKNGTLDLISLNFVARHQIIAEIKLK